MESDKLSLEYMLEVLDSNSTNWLANVTPMREEGFFSFMLARIRVVEHPPEYLAQFPQQHEPIHHHEDVAQGKYYSSRYEATEAMYNEFVRVQPLFAVNGRFGE